MKWDSLLVTENSKGNIRSVASVASTKHLSTSNIREELCNQHPAPVTDHLYVCRSLGPDDADPQIQIHSVFFIRDVQ